MRKPIIVLIAVCWCVALWVLFWGGQATIRLPASPTKGAASSGLGTHDQPRATDLLSEPTGNVSVLYEQLHEAVDPFASWKVPIRFFGRAIDENGSPVPDVAVHIEVLHPSGTSDHWIRSDSNGRFRFAGVRGKSILVSLEKTGFYAFRGPGNGFEFGDPYEPGLRFYNPDPSSPVIFRLHRKGRAEPLIHWQTKFSIPVGGRVNLDASTGRTNSEGGLQFHLLRNDSGHGNGPGEWAMRVTTSNGGLLLHTNEFPFLAPAEGFLTAIDLDEHTPKPINSRVGEDWDGAAFFMRAGQNYARIEVRMSRGSPACDVECFLNPRGSRNLEFDPAVQPASKVYY